MEQSRAEPTSDRDEYEIPERPPDSSAAVAAPEAGPVLALPPPLSPPDPSLLLLPRNYSLPPTE